MSEIFAITFMDGTEVLIRANTVEEAINKIRDFLNYPNPQIHGVDWVGMSEDLSMMQFAAEAASVPPRHIRRPPKSTSPKKAKKK